MILAVLVALGLMVFSQRGQLMPIAVEAIDTLSMKVGSHWSLYRDALGVIQDAPLTGVGLGNFEAIFSQYRDVSKSLREVHHPESDWLWLWAECGLCGLVAVMVMLVAYFYACRSTHQGASGSYRLIA